MEEVVKIRAKGVYIHSSDDRLDACKAKGKLRLKCTSAFINCLQNVFSQHDAKKGTYSIQSMNSNYQNIHSQSCWCFKPSDWFTISGNWHQTPYPVICDSKKKSMAIVNLHFTSFSELKKIHNTGRCITRKYKESCEICLKCFEGKKRLADLQSWSSFKKCIWQSKTSSV